MHLPEEIPFINGLLKKKGLQELVNYCFINYGNAKTVEMLDGLKDLGFLYATKAGVSIGVDDMVIPARKQEIVENARKSVLEVERQRLDGAITHGERHNKIIDIWHRATENVSDEMFSEMKRVEAESGEFNPIFMMADSGARGSKEQVRQLAGMRGLMSKPSGEVIETPITANFREGLSVLQYFISTHGARKGLADTALKTADSGYLTRRLVDVAQDVIITEQDCQTFDGIIVTPIMEGGDILEPLRDRIVGRVAQEDIYDPLTGDQLVSQNEELTDELANAIQEAGIEQVKIRSVLTCETRRGVCRRCYGRNLASGKLVEIGEAVGVIAAESIGEPGTQLTMRTFHVGGTASRVSEQSKHEATQPGPRSARQRRHGHEQERRPGRHQPQRQAADHGGHRRPRKSKKAGAGGHRGGLAREGALRARLRLDAEGRTTASTSRPASRSSSGIRSPRPCSRRSAARSTSRTSSKARTSARRPTRSPVSRRWSSSSRRRPRSAPRPSSSRPGKGDERKYLLPTGAHVMVHNGQDVHPGDILAKIPRATTKTKDITGGLPRVVELFEARHPRDKAVITEVDGTVHHGAIVKGMRRIIVETDEGTRHEYSVPAFRARQRAGRRARARRRPAHRRSDRSARRARGPRHQGAAALPGRQDPGGLPLPVRRHQRQAHRDHLPSDAALACA